MSCAARVVCNGGVFCGLDEPRRIPKGIAMAKELDCRVAEHENLLSIAVVRNRAKQSHPFAVRTRLDESNETRFD